MNKFATQIQVEEDKEFHEWLDAQEADDLQAIENEAYLGDVTLLDISFDEPETFESLDDIVAEQQQYDDQRDLDFYES